MTSRRRSSANWAAEAPDLDDSARLRLLACAVRARGRRGRCSLSRNAAAGAAWYLVAAGYASQAHDLAACLHQQWHDALGPGHPDTLRITTTLGRALQDLDHYDQARQIDEDTLARRRRILGDNHPHTLQSATMLAADLRALGDYQAARALDEDTLARLRQVLGPEHPDTRQSEHNLADDLRGLGELPAPGSDGTAEG
jgi:hypothetical protein